MSSVRTSLYRILRPVLCSSMVSHRIIFVITSFRRIERGRKTGNHYQRYGRETRTHNARLPTIRDLLHGHDNCTALNSTQEFKPPPRLLLWLSGNTSVSIYVVTLRSPGPVSAWMDDGFKTGKPPRRRTRHLWSAQPEPR